MHSSTSRDLLGGVVVTAGRWGRCLRVLRLRGVCVCVRGWLSLASREESQGGLAGGLRAGVEGKQLSIVV